MNFYNVTAVQGSDNHKNENFILDFRLDVACPLKSDFQWARWKFSHTASVNLKDWTFIILNREDEVKHDNIRINFKLLKKVVNNFKGTSIEYPINFLSINLIFFNKWTLIPASAVHCHNSFSMILIFKLKVKLKKPELGRSFFTLETTADKPILLYPNVIPSNAKSVLLQGDVCFVTGCQWWTFKSGH